METQIVMYLGFILAAYSVVGNDTIQTLGTFLASNEKKNWVVLWAFAGVLLSATLIYGWVNYGGDVSYGRLDRYPLPEPFTWPYLLPPLVLLLLTRTGIPVSTSFMILTFFSLKNLNDMIVKSVSGYVVAFFFAMIVYYFISKALEKKFIENPITPRAQRQFVVLQWCSTGFLWSMWLIQDFANIFVYLPRKLDLWELVCSLVVILSLLALIMYRKGGKIQSIVRKKTNTLDVRSATIIDAIYGLVLFFFKELSNVPMSTTWVFIGLLAGREIMIRYRLYPEKSTKKTNKMLFVDLGKVFFGLIVSVALVHFMKLLLG